MRAAMSFLLPSDGVFRRSSTSLQYYLTRQGRCVVLRGGDVTRLPMERCLNWIPDPAPSLQEIMARKITLPQQNAASFPEK